MSSEEILLRVLIPDSIGVPCARMNAGRKLVVAIMGVNTLRRATA